MILYGAGGHGKVIQDILIKSGERLVMFYDDSVTNVKPNYILTLNNISDTVIISIGNNLSRYNIVNNLDVNYGIAIHPFTSISENVLIENGTVIMAGVVINSNVVIGKHSILNTSCSVDHDCILKEFVHISPNATLCGGVEVGVGTHIGAGSTVIPNIKIGNWVTIGAGSVVIENIPDFAVVVGNPAKVIKYNNFDIINYER